MKEYLKTLIQSASSVVEARNLAREYLQALALQSLQRAGAMTAIAFHGGTALRFLYSLPRYSEDLDFALERPSSTYDFRSYLQFIQNDLEAQGYKTTLRLSDKKTVHSAFVRFPGLPYELKLSPHQNEVLAVKIEIVPTRQLERRWIHLWSAAMFCSIYTTMIVHHYWQASFMRSCSVRF
jgi:hypothetical protein